MNKYAPCIPEEAYPGSMCERVDGEYYSVEEADAEIAKLDSLLREAEALLCDTRAGEAANELARRIVRSL